jgi:hypothetical protein
MHTWRLGPETTALVQPAFYAELPFDSARPRRAIRLEGKELPELAVRQISPLGGPADPAVAIVAAERVRELLESEVVEADGKGSTTQCERRGSDYPAC